MKTEIHFGSLHVDRADVTGYTRMIVMSDPGEHGRFEVLTEWIRFDRPMPPAKPEKQTGHSFRFFGKDGVAY